MKPTLYWILYVLPTTDRINLQSPTSPPLFATHLPVVFHAITCKHDIMCQEIYFHAVYLWKVSRNLGTKRTWFTFDLELIPTLNHAIPSSVSDITLLHKLVPFKDVSMSTGFIHLKSVWRFNICHHSTNHLMCSTFIRSSCEHYPFLFSSSDTTCPGISSHEFLVARLLKQSATYSACFACCCFFLCRMGTPPLRPN